MKYWYDTEFIEDGNTIDLISIGIVAEDGREYYAVSTEFKQSKADSWVCANVLVHLPQRYVTELDSPRIRGESLAWKTRARIKQDILDFFDIKKYGNPELWGYYSAYDHVVFCQLFGKMINLPEGYPYYTKDIKQLCVALGDPDLPRQDNNEHHALADARWTKLAYEFLIGLANEPDTGKNRKGN